MPFGFVGSLESRLVFAGNHQAHTSPLCIAQDTQAQCPSFPGKNSHVTSFDSSGIAGQVHATASTFSVGTPAPFVHETCDCS